MPRKPRDYNAVMKPRKHSNKLNVSLIFSTGDEDPDQDHFLKTADPELLSDAFSTCSTHTDTHTDTLQSGVSSYQSSSPSSPPYYPGNWNCSNTLSNIEIPYGAPLTETENIYDSLAPKRDVNRSTSQVTGVSNSTSTSSIVVLPVHETTPTNLHQFNWEYPPEMRSKKKEAEVMRPDRTSTSSDTVLEASPFSKLQRANCLKKRRAVVARKNEESTVVMTPNREPLSTSTTPPSSRHNSLSRDEAPVTPVRTYSDSSRTSGEYKARTLPRKNKKQSGSSSSLEKTETPTPPVRTSSRKPSDSTPTKTPARGGNRASTRKPRPSSLIEPDPDHALSKIPTTPSKTDSKNGTLKKEGTLKRSGTLKKKKAQKPASEPKKPPSKPAPAPKPEPRVPLVPPPVAPPPSAPPSAGKENDPNQQNGSVREEVKPVMVRRESKFIYNDFEEMEALLLEQEALEQKLEKERQEKEELERIKLEQEQKQREMQGTIKSLEDEIVNVDCEMVKLRIENEDLDDLEDQKRSLSARLTQERGKVRQMDDLISLSGMSLYSENGLMLNQNIGDYSKRELLDQMKGLKKDKAELETSIKQMRCDTANDKRKQDKVIKDLMTQIRGFHMPVSKQESVGPQETMQIINDLKSQVEQLKQQNKSQTKLIERLVTERNHHLIEIARLKGTLEESGHLKEEV